LNLLENISPHQPGQDRQNSNLAAIGASLIQNTVTPANITDSFTPSDQGISALAGVQGVGSLNATQRALLATASNLPAQPISAPAPQSATSAPAPATPTPAAIVAALTQAAAIGSPAPVTAIPDVNPAALQSQLQTLNTALSNQGLNTTQITKIDQIASIIQNFSPVAYSDLVYQLKALAQQPAQQTAATAGGAPTTKPNAPS
jgi:hypothetical protein